MTVFFEYAADIDRHDIVRTDNGIGNNTLIQNSAHGNTGRVGPEFSVANHGIVEGDSVFGEYFFEYFDTFVRKSIVRNTCDHMRFGDFMIFNDMSYDLFKSLIEVETDRSGIGIFSVNDYDRNVGSFG